MQAIVKGATSTASAPAAGQTCSNLGAVNENGTAKTYATLSTVLVPVGLVAAAVGGVVLWTSQGSVEAAVTPTSASLSFGWGF